MPLSPTIGTEIAEAPALGLIHQAASRAPVDHDLATYRAVKAELEAGGNVTRDHRTGHVVPQHIRGSFYSPRDLLASAFAEIDVQVGRFLSRSSNKIAAE